MHPPQTSSFLRSSSTISIEVCSRKTLAYDQGKEMARHQGLAERLHLRVYFADPHSPWQPPANENANGLLREYLPKGMEFSRLSQRYLTQVATALNHPPKKMPGLPDTRRGHVLRNHQPTNQSRCTSNLKPPSQ